jgi:hypothetical protein
MPSVPETEGPCENEKGSAGIMRTPCGVFPVESGGPLIGMGILFLIVAFIPVLLGIGTAALPAVFLFGGFGIFLIWLGFTK